MKKISNIILSISISFLCQAFIFGMENPLQKNEQIEEKNIEDIGIHDEIWTNIIDYAYVDPSILDQANNIYDAIDVIEKYLMKCHKSFDLVCKKFKKLNVDRERWIEFKKK